MSPFSPGPPNTTSKAACPTLTRNDLTHRDHKFAAEPQNLPSDGHEAGTVAITPGDRVRWSLRRESAPIAEYEMLLPSGSVSAARRRMTGSAQAGPPRLTCFLSERMRENDTKACPAGAFDEFRYNRGGDPPPLPGRCHRITRLGRPLVRAARPAPVAGQCPVVVEEQLGA